MKTREVTTTGADIPKNYFPDRRKRKKRMDTMREAEVAVDLVEEFGLSHEDALDVVLEQDPDKAAKKMAKKAAPDDADQQKELEGKYRERMKMKKESGKKRK